MKKILYLVTADLFIPFYYQLSEYLKEKGFEPLFVSFNYKEHLLLKKNGLTPQPDNVFSIQNQPIKPDLFSPGELNEILGFTIQKLGGNRNDWENRVYKIASYLDALLQQHRFEALLVWNGDEFISKALVILARRRGLKIIFIENGYFPKTMQLDSKGVNVHNSVTRMGMDEINAYVEKAIQNPLQAKVANYALRKVVSLTPLEYAFCFLQRKFYPSYYKLFPERKGPSWLVTQQRNRQKAQIKTDVYQLPEKFIFIPFQVHDDTQILLNSKFFKSMDDFFAFAYKAIKKHFGDEYTIIVKEHPEDLFRYSYDHLYAKYKDVVWLKKFDLEQLLSKASFVFVINSSVGLQAIQKLKPTIIFGDSFYTKNEFAFCVNDLNRADAVIADAKNGISDQKKRDIGRFIDFLQNHYFVSASWKDITPSGIANSGNRIIGLIESAK